LYLPSEAKFTSIRRIQASAFSVPFCFLIHVVLCLYVRKLKEKTARNI
jgi:hypothetical protein